MVAKKRHPSSRRMQEEKKEAEDIFVEKVVEASSWAKKNSQALIIAGVIVAVLAVGAVYVRSVQANRIQQAVAQLEQVQQAVQFGEREQAKASLNTYLTTFDGTPYALEARLVLGQVHLEEGDPDAAMEVLSPAVREMDSEPLGLQAAFLMAAAYEDAGRLDDGERLFLRIANTAEMNFQIREALAGAARIRGNLGNHSGAAELYQDVLGAMEEEDAERSYWEMKLQEALARMG